MYHLIYSHGVNSFQIVCKIIGLGYDLCVPSFGVSCLRGIFCYLVLESGSEGGVEGIGWWGFGGLGPSFWRTGTAGSTRLSSGGALAHSSPTNTMQYKTIHSKQLKTK